MYARWWGAIACFLVGLFLISDFALADPVLPARTGSVVDAANIIRPDQEQSLAAKAANLKSLSNVELVVVTLPALQGYSIEQWGRALGNGWDIGGSAARGVLLIVAPNDREVRIEVGDGLGSALSDSAASSIIDDVIVPQFRSGEMSGGILAGVDAIAKAVTGSRPSPSVTRQQSVPASSPAYRSESDRSGLPVVLIIGAIVLLNIFGFTGRTSSDDNDNGFFGSSSRTWSSGRSSGSWDSSSSSWSSSRSGRSSRGFSGRGASGRW